MVEILDRWTGAVLYRSETAQTIAEAVVEANERRASLDGASLYGASLDGASLVGASFVDVAEAPLGAVLQVAGTRHFIVAWSRLRVDIGCMRHSLAEWLEQFRAICASKDANYTPDQIEEYGEHLKHVERWIERMEAKQCK